MRKYQNTSQDVTLLSHICHTRWRVSTDFDIVFDAALRIISTLLYIHIIHNIVDIMVSSFTKRERRYHTLVWCACSEDRTVGRTCHVSFVEWRPRVLRCVTDKWLKTPCDLRYVLRITSPPPCAHMRFFPKSKKIMWLPQRFFRFSHVEST